ncbi:MAG: S8 family peptidase [Actinomycetes bacterium]
MSESTQSATRYALAGDTEGRVEILAALDHGRLVKHVLSATTGDSFSAEDSDLVRLSRIRMDAETVRRLVDALPSLYATDAGVTEAEAARAIDEHAAARSADPVDTVLSRLRAYFGLLYHGWAPTMGKNRLVGQVSGGGGTVSFGGGPAPSPAAAPALQGSPEGRGVVVGVLDTGLAPHPALAGRYLAAPTDLIADGGSFRYPAGHGTFVTGLVLQQAPSAAVRAAKVLGDDGQATCWDVANAIVALAHEGVNVLNLSFVYYTADGQAPLALATAVDRLSSDVLVIACAGNHGDPGLKISEAEHRQPAWPAALDDVVAVGSAHRCQHGGRGYELSSFTPPGAAWVDLVADGENVSSTYLTGTGPSGETFSGGASWSGTSFSAALTTGRVAATASDEAISVREAYEKLLPSLGPGQTGEGTWLPPYLDVAGAAAGGR